MKSSYCSQVIVKILIVLVHLVATSWTEGRPRPCPPGQVIHHVDGVVRCCLPVNCGQNHFVKFCSANGSHDVCVRCPRSRALFKRTSSFAYENCQVFPLVENSCKQLPGNPKATAEDIKNCYCELERGQYFMEPEVPLGPLSYCQAFREGCSKGEQPTQEGVCEPCPKNTVQDKNDNFFLCRPQRNCSAMGLETEEVGDTQRETVCAKPPGLPTHRPVSSTTVATTTPPAVVPAVKPAAAATTTKKKKTTVISDKDRGPPSVAPVLDPEGRAGFTTLHIALLCGGGGLVVLIIVVLLVYARRRGWCTQQGTCQRHYDMENQPYPGSSPVCDTDNASDDSCCCTDSCLASSGKSGGKADNACARGPHQPCKALPGQTPMLEGYLNGKCGHLLGSGVEMSEPLYNSISHDESKLSKGDLATYQNVNGVPPTLLMQGDFSPAPSFEYNYPSKVRLPSVDSQEGGMGGDSLKKGGRDLGSHDAEAGKGKEAKDREDFTETDPLLPNLEAVSTGPNPPAGPRPLHGILRNSNQRRDAAAVTAAVTVRGDGREVGGGNRPNLSMLLSSVEGCPQGSGGAAAVANLPHLSQLVSSPHCVQGAGAPPPPQQPALQHQHLQQQHAPEPPQHVHELPPNLQRHLLQHQQHQHQQQQQEGSTLALRPVPASPAPQPAVNTSLVQMDELKPAMSLAPSPTSPAPPPPSATTAAAAATGAANVKDKKDRTGSPARINPSQQKEVRGGGGGGSGSGRDANPSRKPSDTKPLKESAKIPEGAESERALDDETFRKEAVTAATSPVEEEEETTRKSVGGSSGLGESLDLSSPLSLSSEDGRRSRSMYRRSNSEASRSVSPQLPLPPSRSISSPGDKHRPYAVVKPMQSDQSLDALSSSPDQLTELTRPLDSADLRYPLHSLRSDTPERESSQESSDEPDEPTENA